MDKMKYYEKQLALIKDKDIHKGDTFYVVRGYSSYQLPGMRECICKQINIEGDKIIVESEEFERNFKSGKHGFPPGHFFEVIIFGGGGSIDTDLPLSECFKTKQEAISDYKQQIAEEWNG